MEADIEFVAPCQKEIDAYVRKGLPVFAYSFDYVPSSPISEEEKRHFKLFGPNAIKVKRLDRPYEGAEILFSGYFRFQTRSSPLSTASTTLLSSRAAIAATSSWNLSLKGMPSSHDL